MNDSYNEDDEVFDEGEAAVDQSIDYVEEESPLLKTLSGKNAMLAFVSIFAIAVGVGGYLFMTDNKEDFLANPSTSRMVAPAMNIAPGSVPSGQSPLALAKDKKNLQPAVPSMAAPKTNQAVNAQAVNNITKPVSPAAAVLAAASPKPAADVTKKPVVHFDEKDLEDLLAIDDNETDTEAPDSALLKANNKEDASKTVSQPVVAKAATTSETPKASEDKKAKDTVEAQLAAEKTKANKAEEELLDSEIMESELLDKEVKGAKKVEQVASSAVPTEKKDIVAADDMAFEDMMLDEAVSTEVGDIATKAPTVTIGGDDKKAKKKGVDADAASDAELAIVQNSTVLDTLPPPSQIPINPRENILGDIAKNAKASTKDDDGDGQTVESILSQEAKIRPLPKSYLTVKKERDAQDLDAQIAGARTALAQSRYVASLELFNDLYKQYPENSNILMGRAVSMQKLGQSNDALTAYQEVLSVDPGNLEALTNMLGILKGQDVNTALNNLLQLREMYPYNANITAQLGMIYGQTGDYKNALRYLEMAEAMSPGDLNILYNKAVAFDRMGKARQAAEIYRVIVYRSSAEEMDRNFPIEAIKKRLASIR